MKTILLAVMLAQAAQAPHSIPVKSGTIISEETDQATDVLGGLYLNEAAVVNVTTTLVQMQGQNVLLVNDLNKVETMLAKERQENNTSKFIVAVTVVAAVIASGVIAGAVGYGVGQAKGH